MNGSSLELGLDCMLRHVEVGTGAGRDRHVKGSSLERGLHERLEASGRLEVVVVGYFTKSITCSESTVFMA